MPHHEPCADINMVLGSKHFILVFILKLILSWCYVFWLLEIVIEGDSCTQSGTGLLLTLENPELDIL